MVCLPSSSTILVYSLPSVPREQVDQIIQSLICSGTNPSVRSPSAKTTHDPRPTLTTPTRGPRPWTIRNKYYTCDVQFVHLVQAKDGDGHRDDQGRYQVQGDEPAVIVVAPRTQVRSFPFLLQPAHHTHRSQPPLILPEQTPPTDVATLLSSLGSRDPEFDIALLLTSPSPTDQVYPPPDDQAWDDLSLDHAFEYVPSSSSSSSSTLNSTSPSPFKSDADDGGDKRGDERVIEALQARIWDLMIPFPTEAEQTVQETPVESYQSTLINLLPPPSLPKPREYSPVRVDWPERFLPNLVAKGESQDRGEGRDFDDDFSDFVSGPSGALVGRGDQISSESTSLPSKHGSGSGSGSDAQEDDGEEDVATLERQDQELEILFAQLGTAREQALGIKDMDEKRAFAEKTVLSLLG